jgi:LEA14-like dessication related protein
MKKTILYLSILAVFMAGFSACSLMKDIEKAANIVNCQFRVKSADNITLAGVNVQKAQNLQSLSMGDVAMLTTAALGSNLPLNFRLNLEGKNPNTAAAGIVRFDWILFIDGIEMTKGAFNQKVNIPAKGTSLIPIQMSVNLKKVLSGKSADAMLNFGMNLAGAGNKPTRIKLKLKPTINVGTYPLEFPDYISVGTEFSGVK